MLKKALTTISLATVLLTSSISANELATQDMGVSTAKVETIGAFNNIPTQSLNSQELKEQGELAPYIAYLIYGTVTGGAIGWLSCKSYCN